MQKNKEIIIKVKLDNEGNLIYLNLEYDRKYLEDKLNKFQEEVERRTDSGNFTEEEIKIHIERYHPIKGTLI